MSRSKKNWDHLIDETGNYYDISSSQGVKGQKGEQGSTGQKGDEGQLGRKGIKGDEGPAGPVFIWKGIVPTAQDLPFALPGTNGWTYQVEQTGFFHVSNGDRTYSIIESLDVVKGEKGPEGEKGTRGPDGNDGDKGQKGSKGEVGEKGDIGLEGQKGEKGLKGARGEKGFKGEPLTFGDLTNSQQDDLKGAKGERGDKGVPGTDGADAGIPEVADDNKLYLRKFNNWVESSQYNPSDSRVGLNINSATGQGNPSGSGSNPSGRKYAFAVGSVAQGNSHAWTALFVPQGNNNCFSRSKFYVNSYAEQSTLGGQEVAVKANLRSMRTSLREAISEAVDFDDLKSRLITRLDTLEAELQDADPNEPPNDPPV